jgi:hypothetical protein
MRTGHRPLTRPHRRTAWAALLAALTAAALCIAGAPGAFAASGMPSGSIDAVVQSPGSITAIGWADDSSAQAHPVWVRLYVDGAWQTSGFAATPRPDVEHTNPSAGLDHGYSMTAKVREGTHNVCVTALDIPTQAEQQLACRQVTVSFSPYGKVTYLAQAPGGFFISGWAVDPDTSSPVGVDISADGHVVGTVAAGGVSNWLPSHGFSGTFRIPGAAVAPGTHSICVSGRNAGTTGSNHSLACQQLTVNYNPTAGIVSAAQSGSKVVVTGWAMDPDTSGAIRAQITADGTPVATATASGSSGVHPGHMVTASVSLDNGSHTVCVVGLNTLYGSGNSTPSCKTVSVNMSPFGHLDSAKRTSDGTGVTVTGWAIDPDATAAVAVTATVDGTYAGRGVAGLTRTDVGKTYPWAGSQHGYSFTVPADGREHNVCVTAYNTGFGAPSTLLGCAPVSAANPNPPAAPQSVTATADYTTATVHWVAPTDDGGSPLTSYTVTASPSGKTVTVGPTTLAATFTGLSQATAYTFAVSAHNVAGSSSSATSSSVSTKSGPALQTSPAPISTSRYIRNIYNTGSVTDQATMRREGYADAQANPSGHGYMMLLDIGGQSEQYHGVVLSAGVRFVSYTNLVTDLKAYVDGYASGQRSGTPAVIAIGTNNDMDVSTSSGASWANNVVDPIVSYAASKHYDNLTISGANDIEPGFRASYTSSRAWLSGYLAATSAPFVFNGSADGCSWTSPGRSCNNSWTMSGLYALSAGAAPSRIQNLPQVYNSTMAGQWRYISLTGVNAGYPRIRFGGPLTEWTACQQAGSCGSLTGNSAWTTLWNQLNAEPSLRISSLPYSTDLRIDS